MSKHWWWICLWLTSLVKYEQGLGQGSMQDSRWWMGIKGGINFTAVHPFDRYSVFDNVSSSHEDPDKNYFSLFKNAGPSVGITLDYAITSVIGITIQPTYQNYIFKYTGDFIWTDTLSNSVELKNTHTQKLHYIELPLMVKYGQSFGKFRLFAQVGMYYGYLLAGTKVMDAVETYHGSGGDESLRNYTQSYDLHDMYIHSQYGFIGGGGVSADVNFFRIALECNYRYGMNNITNMKNRFTNEPLLSGSYDVPDDIKLRNLEFTVQLSTPLDYLMHMPGFSAKPSKRR